MVSNELCNQSNNKRRTYQVVNCPPEDDEALTMNLEFDV